MFLQVINVERTKVHASCLTQLTHFDYISINILIALCDLISCLAVA